MGSDTLQCSPFEDYSVGQVLPLNVLPNSVLQVRIRQLHTRTFSCTMVVEILGNSLQQENLAFLKLFDRRFSDGLRKNYRIHPWTKEKEKAYIEAVEDGSIYPFLYDAHHVEDFYWKTSNDWYEFEDETFLADKQVEFYEAEVAVYNTLRAHQGCQIPKLLATVDLVLTPNPDEMTDDGESTDEESDDEADGEMSQEVVINKSFFEVLPFKEWPFERTIDETDEGRFEPYKIKGILLEYIEGHDMWDLGDHFPQPSWQGLVNQAIKLIDILDDYSICNKDVKPHNFIVTPIGEGEPQQYQVYMIDFGLCRFRREGETDLEWGRDKWRTDEEGAVGLWIEKDLREKYDYKLEWVHSFRWIEWAEGEDDEELEEFSKVSAKAEELPEEPVCFDHSLDKDEEADDVE